MDERAFIVDGQGGRRLRLTFSSIPDEDGVLHLLEQIQDVTEEEILRARAANNERFALIGRMGAKLAHAVRTPLGPISVNLDVGLRALPPGAAGRAASADRNHRSHLRRQRGHRS